MYLAEAVHTITLIRDIGLLYNINSPNHLPYNSVYTAFCVAPQRTLKILDNHFTVSLFTPPPHWSDGMRCCRSDWPGLCLFCCYQPLCVISQQS